MSTSSTAVTTALNLSHPCFTKPTAQAACTKVQILTLYWYKSTNTDVPDRAYYDCAPVRLLAMGFHTP